MNAGIYGVIAEQVGPPVAIKDNYGFTRTPKQHVGCQRPLVITVDLL